MPKDSIWKLIGRGKRTIVLDLKDPAKPEEVGRWWMPGQWTAGGETPTWHGTDTRCHHPIRRDDRLYISYWHGGFVILDIEDMSKPKRVSGMEVREGQILARLDDETKRLRAWEDELKRREDELKRREEGEGQEGT